MQLASWAEGTGLPGVALVDVEEGEKGIGNKGRSKIEMERQAPCPPQARGERKEEGGARLEGAGFGMTVEVPWTQA